MASELNVDIIQIHTGEFDIFKNDIKEEKVELEKDRLKMS